MWYNSGFNNLKFFSAISVSTLPPKVMQVAVRGLFWVIVFMMDFAVMRARISGSTSHILMKARGGFLTMFFDVVSIHSAISIARGLIVFATITFP